MRVTPPEVSAWKQKVGIMVRTKLLQRLLSGTGPARLLSTRISPIVRFDALYDFLTEQGANLKVVFRNAAHVSPVLRLVCSDAVQGSSGLEITFEDSKDAAQDAFLLLIKLFSLFLISPLARRRAV